MNLKIPSEKGHQGLFFLAKMVKDYNNCKVIVELGIGWAHGAMAMLNAIPNVTYYGYDIWRNPFEKKARENLNKYEHVNIIKKDSHTLNKIPDADLIHIDGDHSTPGCTQDLELAHNSLNSKGVILVHDMDFRAVQTAVNTWYEKNKEEFNMKVLEVGQHWAIIWRKQK